MYKFHTLHDLAASILFPVAKAWASAVLNPNLPDRCHLTSLIPNLGLFGWIQSSLLALSGIAPCVWTAARRMRYVIWWPRHFTDHWAHQNTRKFCRSWLQMQSLFTILASPPPSYLILSITTRWLPSSAFLSWCLPHRLRNTCQHLSTWTCLCTQWKS